MISFLEIRKFQHIEILKILIFRIVEFREILVISLKFITYINLKYA